MSDQRAKRTVGDGAMARLTRVRAATVVGRGSNYGHGESHDEDDELGGLHVDSAEEDVAV